MSIDRSIVRSVNRNLKTSIDQSKNSIDLGMRALFVHGDVVIADSASEVNGYVGACATFKKWVNKEWPKTVKA